MMTSSQRRTVLRSLERTQIRLNRIEQERAAAFKARLALFVTLKDDGMTQAEIAAATATPGHRPITSMAVAKQLEKARAENGAA